ncbi:MAG TPA: hypothetical protein VG965_06395, partial [Patescibacteria group bacterium]|nr:hypothetical protein [Patescibacteria group bacterium]
IGVSSKTGENIKELLDLIVLVYDLSAIKKTADGPFQGVVIDAKADRRRGIVSTVVIKSGKIAISDPIFIHGKPIGKIRAIVAATGANIKEAVAGEAVEILGATEVLPAGSVLFDREVEPIVAPSIKPAAANIDMMAFLRDDKKDFVPIILKTESAAELEALKNSLPEQVTVIYEGQGEITVSDILMAKDFHALVLGFNAAATKEAESLAQSEKVFYKSYGIIYELLDELNILMDTLSQGEVEKELGRGQILASFMGSSGPIIGLRIVEGRLAVGDRIKVKRSEKELGSSKIVSIRHGKEDIKVANKNTECGIVIEPLVDFAPQDAIIAYSKVQPVI